MAALVIGFAMAACVGPDASFSPDGPCAADGRAPGTYPELEALLPDELTDIADASTRHAPPTTVDSGRNCTARSLSTYAAHGVSDVRFAGATWDWGDGTATVSAVFSTPEGQPALASSWVEEFYETGARASTKTENIVVSYPTTQRAGPVYRLETLNDLSLQTVVVWPADSIVRVVIVATTVQPNASREQHDDRVDRAVDRTACVDLVPPVAC